jgi:sugar phosphate permease
MRNHSSEIVTEKGNPGQNRIFYGWWIVVVATFISVITSGIGFYSHGVILDPIQNRFGWSKGVISTAISLNFVIIGIMGLFISRPIEKYGPRQVMVMGSIIAGIAFALLGTVKELWHLYALYILMAMGWSGTSLLPINTVITNWFIRRRGFAMSITMMGMSLGGIILVPLSTYLIACLGLRTALFILGMLVLVFIIPLTLLVIKQQPSDVGQFPDGTPLQSTLEQDAVTAHFMASQQRAWTRRQAMGTLPFWSIVVAFLFALTGQMAYLTHQISFLSLTLGRAGAATAVSITAAASIMGRLVVGLVADRCDKRYVTIVLWAIQILAMLSMAYSDHVIVLYLGTFVFGLVMGSILLMQPLLTGECFGMVSFATVYGLMGVFVFSGAAMGPTIAGILYDSMGSYRVALTFFAALTFLAIFAVLFARPPGRNKKTPAHG